VSGFVEDDEQAPSEPRIVSAPMVMEARLLARTLAPDFAKRVVTNFDEAGTRGRHS
jgi:hypothetical protein